MSDRLHEALQVCLEALSTGVDLEACLKLYPDMAEELRPALSAALMVAAVDVPAPAPQIIARSRARLLARAEQLHDRRSGFRLSWPLPRLAFTVLAVAFGFLFGSLGLLAASAQSLPGDTLYPVKRTVEEISLRLAPGEGAKRSLEMDYELRREEEVHRLIQSRRTALVSFEGVVNAMTAEGWTVGDVPVLRLEDTVIMGEIEVGDEVEVEGETQPDGIVLAHEVHLRKFELAGRVRRIGSETWTIENIELDIRPTTEVDPAIREGDRVLALIHWADNGRFTALAIVRLPEPTATPQPTATPLPPATQTPQHAVEKDEQDVTFTGVVNDIGPGQWTIGNQQVLVDDETEIKGDITLGDTVKVHAVFSQDGTFRAREVERLTTEEGDDRSGESETPAGETNDEGTDGGTQTPPADEGQEHQDEDGQAEKSSFTGTLQSKGGSTWVIDGTPVLIDGSTEIEGDPEVGDEVKVEAERQSDGQLLAMKIEKKD